MTCAYVGGTVTRPQALAATGDRVGPGMVVGVGIAAAGDEEAEETAGDAEAEATAGDEDAEVTAGGAEAVVTAGPAFEVVDTAPCRLLAVQPTNVNMMAVTAVSWRKALLGIVR